MMNLLIQSITWNYVLGHRLLTWWKTFLDNGWVENYKELVEKLLESLPDIGANMSIKVHFLHSHLDKFLHNCGAMSDEQREQFHKDIKIMEECYQGRWAKRMMADFCRSIKRDLNDIEHDNQERENFCHGSDVHGGFISTVRLLNDLMKNLLALVYSWFIISSTPWKMV